MRSSKLRKRCCYYGSAHPRQDMPRIADWVGRGLLDVSGLVRRRYSLAEINRALTRPSIVHLVFRSRSPQQEKPVA